MKFTIRIHMDRNCRSCARAGALASGYCLSCVRKRIGTQRNVQPFANASQVTTELRAMRERVKNGDGQLELL